MYIILKFFQSLVYSFFYLRDKFLCNHIINVFCDFIFFFTESSNLESNVTDYNCFSNPLSENSKNAISETVKNYFVSTFDKNQAKNENETKQINEAFELIAEREFQDCLGSQILKTYSLTKSNGEKGPELNVKDITEFFFNVLNGKIQIREIDGKLSFDELKKNYE